MAQCLKSPEGASGSSAIRAKLLVSFGASLHSSGGERFSPSSVYLTGRGRPASNAGLLSSKAIRALLLLENPAQPGWEKNSHPWRLFPPCRDYPLHFGSSLI